jgi:RNA polymerase sigma factor (sigma-70 family)
MSDVTAILHSAAAGDPQAAEQLLPLVYDELRKLAAARLAHEHPGQTLSATSLVHEAYLRLVGHQGPGNRSQEPGNRSQEPGPRSQEPADLAPGHWPLAPGSYNSRGHFFGAAAEAMRRILVERARQKLGPQRGGGRKQIPLGDIGDVFDSQAEQVLAIHEALDALAQESPRAAELVKRRYFAGMSHQEAAESLEISRATADRLWAYAKAALYCELAE